MPNARKSSLVAAANMPLPAAPATIPAALSIPDGGNYIGVSRPTIYRLIKVPGTPIKTIRIGRRRLILRASLDAFLSAQVAPYQPSTDMPHVRRRAAISTAS